MSLDKNEIERKMKVTIENYINDLSTIRTGRASTKLLNY